MPPASSQADRLLKRYPDLVRVPQAERKAVVRAALRRPSVVIVFLLLAVVGMPAYLQWLLPWLDSFEMNLSLGLICKAMLGVVLPVWGITFLVSKGLMPSLVRGEIRKRGYDAGGK